MRWCRWGSKCGVRQTRQDPRRDRRSLNDAVQLLRLCPTPLADSLASYLETGCGDGLSSRKDRTGDRKLGNLRGDGRGALDTRLEHPLGRRGRRVRATRPDRSCGRYRPAGRGAAAGVRTRSGCRGRTPRQARATSSASTPPRIASMSSFAFNSTPIVSLAESRSSASRSSAVRAAAQSSVSDTPGTL